jgi:hypothetical protein
MNLNLTQKAIMPFQPPTLRADLNNAGETGKLADALMHNLRDLAMLQNLAGRWQVIVSTPDRSQLENAEVNVKLKAGTNLIAQQTLDTSGGTDGVMAQGQEVDLYNVGGQQNIGLEYEIVTASSGSDPDPVDIHGWLEVWQPMVVLQQ